MFYDRGKLRTFLTLFNIQFLSRSTRFDSERVYFCPELVLGHLFSDAPGTSGRLAPLSERTEFDSRDTQKFFEVRRALRTLYLTSLSI